MPGKKRHPVCVACHRRHKGGSCDRKPDLTAKGRVLVAGGSLYAGNQRRRRRPR